MKKESKDGELNLSLLLFKFRNQWYYFVLSVLVTLAAAFFFTRSASPRYGFKARMLMEEESGSKRAQDALKLLDPRFGGAKVVMSDEVGLITSSAMVKRAVERLDFTVSYFHVENGWLNRLGDYVVREKYEDLPFKVVLNPADNQLVGAPVYITLLSPKQYQLRVKTKRVNTYNLQDHQPVRTYSEVDITKTLDVNQPYQDEYLSFKIIPKPNRPMDGGKYFFVINDLDYLTKTYQSKVVAKPLDRDSRLLELTTQGEIPEKEIRFLNKLMEVYIESDLEEKNQTGIKTLNFIDKQLSQVSDSLRRAQQALARFQRSERLIDPRIQSGNVFQRLEALQTERDRTLLGLKYYQNVLTTLRNQTESFTAALPASVGVDNAGVNSLMLQLSDLYRQRAGFNVYSTKKDNPLLQGVESKITSTKQSLVDQLTSLVSSANLNLSDLDRRIAQAEGNVYRMPGEEMELLNLQGKTSLNDKTSDFLQEKRTEAAIALATNVADKRVIDDAQLASEEPIFPKAKPIFLIALLIGLFIPASVILVKDKLDTTIKGKEDLNEVTRIPFLGMISNAGKGSKLAIIEKPKSLIAESFRSVRVNLQYLAIGTSKKVIGVTSSVSGEGKTFCSVNLSCELALSGKKTLLIETDLRKPTVSRYFGTANKVGLSSYLIKSNPLDEVIHKTKVKNLDVITSGPVPPNPIELLGMPEMESLLHTLREVYDYIILDIPPIGFVSDYFILLRHIDANIYVVRHKYTTRDMLEPINELYNENKINHLYMVINGMDFNSSYEYGYKTKSAGYYK
ncbi:MAG: polysaccharide biosynthesis tyrosine autokinase [Ferruginibacter sp.]|nr:polysaccharide biosynthesis tyrosine autokinase [Cytophagales bacterium]